jgi:serine/threonine protein kinase
VYQAYQNPNAKDLFNFLTTINENNQQEGSEDWARFLFRQIIAGLKCMHDNNIAHLDIHEGNILVHIDDNWLPRIKIGGFGLSQRKNQGLKAPYGRFYSAPELRGDD